MTTYLLLGFIIQTIFIICRILSGVYDVEAWVAFDVSFVWWVFSIVFAIWVWPLTVLCEILYATNIVKRPGIEVDIDTGEWDWAE